MTNTAAIVTTPRIPAHPVTSAWDHGSRSSGGVRRPRSHWVSSTQRRRVAMTVPRTAAHAVSIRPTETEPSSPLTMRVAWRPMSRNTACSSRNATVDQVTRSVRRDPEVCTIGALCPMTSPATTTAMTPEACSSSARR